jgi:hypothetical protein
MEQNPITITIVVGEDLCCSHVATLFDDKASADLTITGGSESTKKLRAHSHLLSSASPVFKKMLEGDWKESGGVVELKEIDWDVVIALISLIYMRPVDLREDLLVDLYRAAHMYDVPVALKAVVGCVPRMESKECVVDLAITANSLEGESEDEMASACGSYLIKCLDDVEDIRRIPYKTMMAVAKAEGTDLDELTILNNLLKWSREHKEEVTLEERRELFSYIRYGQVPLEDMLEALSGGGFPCGEEFSKMIMFHSSCDPADIIANMPLFTPRLRPPASPSFKEFFPIAAKRSTNCPTVSHCNDKGWDFGIVESLCIVCKDKCTFSISGGDLGQQSFKYLNMKISTVSSRLAVCLSVQIDRDRVRKVVINVQSDHFLLSLCNESRYRYYSPYIQDFRHDFPRVFNLFYANTSFPGMNQVYHCDNHILQYGTVFDTKKYV